MLKFGGGEIQSQVVPWRLKLVTAPGAISENTLELRQL